MQKCLQLGRKPSRRLNRLLDNQIVVQRQFKEAHRAQASGSVLQVSVKSFRELFEPVAERACHVGYSRLLQDCVMVAGNQMQLNFPT